MVQSVPRLFLSLTLFSAFQRNSVNSRSILTAKKLSPADIIHRFSQKKAQTSTPHIQMPSVVDGTQSFARKGRQAVQLTLMRDDGCQGTVQTTNNQLDPQMLNAIISRNIADCFSISPSLKTITPCAVGVVLAA